MQEPLDHLGWRQYCVDDGATVIAMRTWRFFVLRIHCRSP
jgi:hypothetical protein